MNTTDFHITKVMPDVQMKEIVRQESVCPVCGSNHTEYSTYHRHNNAVWQNAYKCMDCKSEWRGNTYDESFKRITPEDERKLEIIPNPFLEGLAYLFSL